jgi:tripartite-type tricarboxylate transporter receptor subunit TctC
MRMRFAFCAAVMLSALVLVGTAVAQQSWPQRPVRIVVPLPAGSAVDLTSRLFAERLAQKWGQGVVVENRLGADGIVAVNSFLAARDDHQLLVSFGGVVTVNPLLNTTLSYDPKELVPISVLVDNFLGIAATAEMNAPTMADVVKLARAAPGKYTWAATPGQTAVIMPALLKLAGIDLLRVSYSNFTVALQDLAQGRLHLVATSLPALLPLVQSGKAKLLMVTNPQRSPQVPDAPTASEAGYAAVGLPGSVVLFASKDLTADRRDQIAADFAAVAREPEFVARMGTMGLSVRAGTPAEALADLNDQRSKIEGALKLMQ